MAESDRFCRTCLDAIKHLKGITEIRVEEGPEEDHLTAYLLHHPTAAKLRSAAASGCFFCSALWDQCSDTEKTTLLDLDQNHPK